MTSAGAAARLEETRAGLLASIDTALGKLTRTASEIEQAPVESSHAHELRSQGELLLAFASQIRSGAREATVTGYDGRPVTIPLDPARSPVDNAQRLFKRYAKLRDALTALSARQERLAADRQFLEHARAHALHAETLDALEDLRQELLAEGFVRARGRPSKPSRRAGPRSFSLAGGYTVLVGRTKAENERVTFALAGPEDLWFHARGVAGAHVVLKTGGRHPQMNTIEQAAAIAADFSTARESRTVAVDYTQRKYVRKPKGAKPGLVTYEREKTIFVKPELPATGQRDNATTR
ncbi:MAG: NFACT family protein, partial [Armatimonadetes bacterium]|nr:NFACT family protein [Armatimonadota bacterium]